MRTRLTFLSLLPEYLINESRMKIAISCRKNHKIYSGQCGTGLVRKDSSTDCSQLLVIVAFTHQDPVPPSATTHPQIHRSTSPDSLALLFYPSASSTWLPMGYVTTATSTRRLGWNGDISSSARISSSLQQPGTVTPSAGTAGISRDHVL